MDANNLKSKYVNEKEKLMNAWLNPTQSYANQNFI